MELFGKIKLTVCGREEEFSEGLLRAKLERLEKLKALQPKKFEVANKPTEGKCFMVNPKEILKNEQFFRTVVKAECENEKELARYGRDINIQKAIITAINEVKKNPKKYGECFYLLIPKREWVYSDDETKTFDEQMAFVEYVEGDISNWITEPLGWAQRLLNGESWEELTGLDTIEWIRWIVWRDGSRKRIGGYKEECYMKSACVVESIREMDVFKHSNTIPSIVLKSLYCPL